MEKLCGIINKKKKQAVPPYAVHKTFPIVYGSFPLTREKGLP
jgi:hypothetical protein